MGNEALWLDGPGREPRVGTAELYEKGEGELLIKVMAIPVQPGEWKIQEGIIPIPLKYPTVIGLGLSGVVEKVGSGVTRFKLGDRVMRNTSGVLRNDYRFGAYQNFVWHLQLSLQRLARHLSKKPQISVLPMHPLARFSYTYALIDPRCRIGVRTAPARKSSSGVSRRRWAQSLHRWPLMLATLWLASRQGGMLSWRSHLGFSSFVNRSSPEVLPTLTGLGPFKAVFAAADSAEDQVKIGEVLAAHGGGTFLSTMGVRDGVQLPQSLSGKFTQCIDDFLSPENREFTEWVWWDYLEKAVSQGKLQSTPIEAKGDLSQTKAAWNALKAEEVSGKRLVIRPNSE